MPRDLHPNQLQPQILRTYTTLHQLRATWPGSLILSLGLNPEGAALSTAANIAGAVSLAIDNNPVHIREVVRSGACDFVVTTLDEAIRAMKNEVRKHAPLSVALQIDPFLALNEILDRGLLPQLFSTFLPSSDLTTDHTVALTQAALHFQTQGASLIDFTQSNAQTFTSSDTLLIPLLAERHWTLHTFSFDTPAALRSFDAHALSLLSPDETLRRRWLEAAPRILQRQRPPQRSLWLTESELSAINSVSQYLF
jgi:urocanate hydratase